jgi:hypothetical protein
MFKDHELFVRDMEEQGGRYGEEALRRLFAEVKRQIPAIINANRKTPKGVASPVGYVQGKLGRSVRYRVRKWERKSGGASVQGYLYVGEGLAYARIHDFDGTKPIVAKTERGLVFFNHRTKKWAGMGPVRVHEVGRPGSPYFDEAVNYSMRKLGL